MMDDDILFCSSREEDLGKILNIFFACGMCADVRYVYGCAVCACVLARGRVFRMP